MLLRSILLICSVIHLNYGSDIANVETDDDDGWDIIESSSVESLNVRTPVVEEPEVILTRTIDSASVDNRASGCTTPEGNGGSCIPIRQCKLLNDLLKYKFHEPGVPERLRKSQCGDRKSATHDVCCPQTLSYRPTTPPIPKTSSPPPVSSEVPKDKFRKYSFQLVKPVSSLNIHHCGNRTVGVRVVGGNESELGAWPWMAALYCSNSVGKQYFQCGGTLISNQWVLTASHCLKCGDKSTTLTFVRLGDLDLRDNVDDKASPIDIQIQQIVQHPQYTSSPIQNDIALLRLSQPVKFSTHIYPICLFSGESYNADEFYHNKKPFVAGWGSKEYGTASTARLMEARVPIVNIAECEKNYVNQRGQSVIDKRVLCAGDGNRDSCSGDSGGPLMFYHKQKGFYQGGVVSFGVKCAEKNYPGVYTKVASFIEWIKQTTGLSF